MRGARVGEARQRRRSPIWRVGAGVRILVPYLVHPLASRGRQREEEYAADSRLSRYSPCIHSSSLPVTLVATVYIFFGHHHHPPVGKHTIIIIIILHKCNQKLIAYTYTHGHFAPLLFTGCAYIYYSGASLYNSDVCK